MKKGKIQQAQEILEKEGYKVIPPKEEIVGDDGWLTIPELSTKEYSFQVEINVHDKNKSWDKLGLKDREDELLTAEETIFLANSKYASILKMDGSSSKDDFFIKQPFNLSRANGRVARFYAGSDCADLICDGGSDDSYSYLGVRFVRKKILKANKK